MPKIKKHDTLADLIGTAIKACTESTNFPQYAFAPMLINFFPFTRSYEHPFDVYTYSDNSSILINELAETVLIKGKQS